MKTSEIKKQFNEYSQAFCLDELSIAEYIAKMNTIATPIGQVRKEVEDLDEDNVQEIDRYDATTCNGGEFFCVLYKVRTESGASYYAYGLD